MNITLVDWSACQEVWEECSKVGASCGCIGEPTILILIIIFIIAGIFHLIIKSQMVK